MLYRAPIAALAVTVMSSVADDNAWADTWIVDPGTQVLGWTVPFNDNTLTGRFTDFSSQIVFDPADLANASTTVSVRIDSVAAETDEQAQELVKPEWFDAQTFPTATFTSTSFQALGGDEFSVAGTLTIRDQSHPITIPITFAITGDNATIEGNTALNRIDFGVGQGDWSIDDVVGFTVSVHFSLAATRGN